MISPPSFEHPHFGTVDLSNCDREPIHVPGAVQPHGVLLAFQEETCELAVVSSNTQKILGDPPAELLGQPLARAVEESNATVICDALAMDGLKGVNPLRLAIGGQELDGILHRTGGLVVLELEPPPPPDGPAFRGGYHAIGRALDRLRGAGLIAEMCDVAAAEMRVVTGFDRVMVYRFDEDWAGEVVSEARRDDLEAFLTLRYPASDIPAQARRLYTLNWLRLIPDVDYRPAELIPALSPATGEPLDLSFSVLRSVSPMHIAYLRNMGVMASMSISLVADGKLWGLIACHHYSPHFVPYELRQACELLGQMLSWQIAARTRSERSEKISAARAHHLRLIERAAAEAAPILGLREAPKDLLTLVGAEGAALLRRGEIELIGRTPPGNFVEGLVTALHDELEGGLFVTDRLNELYSPAAEHRTVASGLLAVEVAEGTFVIWFRPEVIETVVWGSNPDKRAILEGGQDLTLTPEGSFRQWRETVRGRSIRWLPWEVEAALEFAGSLRGLLARRAMELEELNAELRSANLAKDEFLALVSHELRTPLNAVLGWATVARTGPPDLERYDKALTVIERNAQAQAQLVEDLLDISRIIGGRLRLDVQPVQPIASIEAAVDSVRTAADAKRIRVQTILDDKAGPVLGDPARLQQVVWNLLTNAIKFTDKGGRVQVRLLRDHSSVLINVADNGIGMDPEFVPMVFERFRQAESGRTRSTSGLGLGLAIVKHLVEMHGGTVTAQSPGPGKGSSFGVRLPLSPIAGDSSVSTTHPTSGGSETESPQIRPLDRIRVLLVEDEPDAVELLSTVLGEAGAEVKVAVTVREALRRFGEQVPDLVISDIGLPETDGYELIRTLRRRPRSEGGRVPAIALTAYARPQDRTRAFAAGFQAHVAKPVDPHELVSAASSLADRD